MSDPTREQLQQAYQLIKARRKAEAKEILIEVLTANPSLVDGYWLWSLAAETPDEAREALQEILSIDPSHERARNALERLNQRYPPRRPEPPPAEPEVDDDELPDDDLFTPLSTPVLSEAEDEEEEDKPLSAAQIGLTSAKGAGSSIPVGPLMLIGVALVLVVMAVLIVLDSTQIGACNAQEWLDGYNALMNERGNALSNSAGSSLTMSPELIDGYIDALKGFKSDIKGLGSRPCVRGARDNAVKIFDIIIDIFEKAKDVLESDDPEDAIEAQAEIVEKIGEMIETQAKLDEELRKLQETAMEEAMNP
jgi:hypothetical protein